jgi:RNA polymerase sigma-70 factor (ECF subfamily)
MSRSQTHLSDEAVLALVGRGDHAALGELYDRLGRTAYGLALRVVRNPGLAEDIVQDAFLTVWSSARKFAPEQAKASTWIMMLVHRRAVDVVRREQRRRSDPLEAAPEPVDTGADEAVWLRLERERVQDALRHLPDREREAIELAYYGGYTQSELAKRLNQPLGTIKHRTFTGLARLRALLETPNVEEGTWSTPRSAS